jgi:hypothetical protein
MSATIILIVILGLAVIILGLIYYYRSEVNESPGKDAQSLEIIQDAKYANAHLIDELVSYVEKHHVHDTLLSSDLSFREAILTLESKRSSLFRQKKYDLLRLDRLSENDFRAYVEEVKQHVYEQKRMEEMFESFRKNPKTA